MGGARLVARVPHTHLVPKGHGLVRVLRCDVRHNILQERGLLRFGEETERHRPLTRKPDYMPDYRDGNLSRRVSDLKYNVTTYMSALWLCVAQAFGQGCLAAERRCDTYSALK